jgi:hypothetical protein
MNPNTQNHAVLLAEQFLLQENSVHEESKIALLKVQSFRFAMKTPEVGIYYQQEAGDMVRRALLSFVPNTFILSEVGFYFAPIEN